jgi:hypothetical protein
MLWSMQRNLSHLKHREDLKAEAMVILEVQAEVVGLAEEVVEEVVEEIYQVVLALVEMARGIQYLALISQTSSQNLKLNQMKTTFKSYCSYSLIKVK